MLVILDRDGVINEDRPDFVKSPEELVLIPQALTGIAKLTQQGHILTIATNQSCIGRGLVSAERIQQINNIVLSEIHKTGGKIEHIFVAPDAPWEATEMRKPGAGMLLAAMRMFRHKPEETCFIGDSLTDLQAGAKAGCKRILVQTGKGKKTQAAGITPDLLPVSVAKTLLEAAEQIGAGNI